MNVHIFANEKLNAYTKGVVVYEKKRNNAGKGKIAGYSHFKLFCFLFLEKKWSGIIIMYCQSPAGVFRVAVKTYFVISLSSIKI